MGEHPDPGAHFVMVEEKRNILIGFVLIVYVQLIATESYLALGSSWVSHHSSSWKRPFVLSEAVMRKRLDIVTLIRVRSHPSARLS